MRKRHGVELVVIDYLQMLHDSRGAKESRQNEIANVSGTIKAIAKELHIPVLVLAQLNRSSEERGAMPKLADLRESGQIEQDADVVMLLRRPCRIKGDKDFEDKTLAVVDVAKQRNGRTGEIKMNFEDEYTRFADRAHLGADVEVAAGAAEAGE